ncbi:Nucleoside-diphosphate-sugar epimerase [Salinimicrobium catena]|uniref:Nucleoside-diphosphate-sugar epimerase n=1 Tax=Salinimicrobium catena TaxID=390640 RepID=A0A1H5HUD9_9FLAO|nr:NAD(P)H-binding protein [Salinimicrobium catena]SDK72611.1 Nucleoside-diphosphate-sugar epimerase [Salinimicrobium catena]SEE31311.1 Nucleoside-diphosphate-sugar epimerase [Salinimicrobium catena]
MSDKKNIAILGTGWLGLPLAKMLLKKGSSVKGSTTSEAKLDSLKAEGIQPYLVKVAAEGISGDISGFLAETDVLIVDIPPGLRKDPNFNFSGGIKKLSEEIEKAKVKKVLFVSSISVYAETESFKIYTEAAAPNATSRGGKELAAAEKILMKNPFFETTVLRFGGLFGPQRHPVKYLAGRKNLSNPLGPVNLIHQEDCIGIILKILEKEVFGEVFNAVYPLSPPREEYYQKKAKELGLEPPLFDHSKPSAGKIISASKAMRELDYEFKQPI